MVVCTPAALPGLAHAQQGAGPPRKVVRIGVLTLGVTRSTTIFEAFLQGLRELGYIEGQNMLIDFRNAEGQVDRLPDLAADVVRLGADIIVTATEPATRASPFSWWR